jgi:hypothetical protein
MRSVLPARFRAGLTLFFVLMESATLWKVDATEAGPRADLGLERLP